MAQPEPQELLLKAISGEIPARDAVAAVVDRDTGRMRLGEGEHIDFKIRLDLSQSRAVGELAKDILGFSNAQGGVLLFGVEDDGRVIGHPPLNPAGVRSGVGPYVGSRVLYDVDQTSVIVGERRIGLPFILVHRTTSMRPGLLRRDVELRAGLVRKVRYLRGSFPYRHGAETRVVPTGAEIEEVARGFGFTYVTPRTRSSFLVVEDRPSVRLYDHINDRFVGRDDELATLLHQLEDPRGRGISIGGLGGIGKTELAIGVVNRLYQQKRFARIYSGSAKRTLLTPLGPQQADPEFQDYPSFLKDIGAWLGIETTGLDLAGLEQACQTTLTGQERTLLFIDNLETIEDERLFEFLDSKLPANVWRLVTSRVHKIRNYVFTYDLGEMNPRDGGRLLRHELKRQGLDDLAGIDINQLESVAGKLNFHPLAIRWFAWACAKDRGVWGRGPAALPTRELEAFCVAHTLANLSEEAVHVIAAIVSSQGLTEVDSELVIVVSDQRADLVDSGLYELETAGLIAVAVNPETGKATYGVVQMAVTPVRELIRQRGMEEGLATRLRKYTRRPLKASADPLVRYLVDLEVSSIRHMDHDDIRELLARIERARKFAGGFELELTHLQAECERRLGNVITSDDLYRQAADQVLADGNLMKTERFQRLVIEAATVAMRRGPIPAQLTRAIAYLEVVPDDRIAPLRIPGMLCEASAYMGDVERYERYRALVTSRLADDHESFSAEQREQCALALSRAEQAIKSKG